MADNSQTCKPATNSPNKTAARIARFPIEVPFRKNAQLRATA
jgi:hypothetical protein